MDATTSPSDSVSLMSVHEGVALWFTGSLLWFCGLLHCDDSLLKFDCLLIGRSCSHSNQQQAVLLKVSPDDCDSQTLQFSVRSSQLHFWMSVTELFLFALSLLHVAAFCFIKLQFINFNTSRWWIYIFFNFKMKLAGASPETALNYFRKDEKTSRLSCIYSKFDFHKWCWPSTNKPEDTSHSAFTLFWNDLLWVDSLWVNESRAFRLFFFQLPQTSIHLRAS